MHLSIQKHAHAHAEVLVKAWGKQAQVQISAVRYHILRNALILKDIHIQRDDDQITIQHMLIRTNPALLNQPVLHIDSVEISGLKARLHISKALQSDSKHVWQDDPQLMKLWQATNSLKAQGGQLQLYVSAPDTTPPSSNKPTATPLIINNISIQLSTQSTQRSLIASGRLHEGSVQWQQTSDTQHKTSNGQLHWQHINTLALSHALSLQPIAGHLQGDLTWQRNHQDPAQPQNSASLKIQSKLRFNASDTDPLPSTNSAAQEDNNSTQQLEFSATEQNNIWNIDLHAIAWPLAPWGQIIPAIGSHQLTTAQWSGSSHWRQVSNGWQINADKGILKDVVLATENSGDNTHWSWRELHYDSLLIDSARHQMHLSQLKLNDGNLIFNTQSASNNEIAAAQPWRTSIDHIQANGMLLSFILANGQLDINDLQAQATWPKKSSLDFKIYTTTPASSTSNKPITPQWRLRGSINRATATQNSSADFSVGVKHAALSSLRLLMPLQDDSNSPVSLSGNMDWRSQISLHQGMWRIQGKATAYDVQLSHAGDRWGAKQIDTRFGPIGTGLTLQTISRITVADWSCVAALEPLQPLLLNAPEAQPSPNRNRSNNAWWALILNNNNMQIQQLRFNNGSLSIGHDESLWATDINIMLDHLKTNHWADLNIEADVSGGEFKLVGKWNPLSDIPRFRGTASLNEATPFFLHEWMTASGMPRLIRGRLNASLNIKHQSKTDSYQSKWQLQFSHAMPETGFFSHDPMLTRSGLNTAYLLRRLSGENNNITLQGKLHGSWQQQPLNLNRLGDSLQTVLRATASETQTSETGKAEPPANIVAHIRLHERKSLSLNERSRLFKIVRQLHDNPNMSVELKPQWAGDELNSALLHRIQHTQQLIERFLRHRKISRQRIFPRWPTTSEQNNEVSFIQIELNP
ncbi:MAG: hypothetical protein Q9M16_03095 [Mariprofundus sp.]|nr:hypothetical protein [Mariprofundus sp.]